MILQRLIFHKEKLQKIHTIRNQVDYLLENVRYWIFLELSIVEEQQEADNSMETDYQAQEDEEEVAYEDDDEPLARIASYESCEDEVNLDELDFSEDIQQESEELELDESMKFIWITKVSSELNPKTAARSIRAFGVRCGIKFAKNKTDTAILLSCETAKGCFYSNFLLQKSFRCSYSEQ